MAGVHQTLLAIPLSSAEGGKDVGRVAERETQEGRICYARDEEEKGARKKNEKKVSTRKRGLRAKCAPDN